MGKCETCQYANRSGNKDFVYCTFWQNKCNHSQMETEKFIRSVLFQDPRPRQVALGWGFPHQPYVGETDWVVKGTATEGIMWNEQICVSKEENCNHYVER